MPTRLVVPNSFIPAKLGHIDQLRGFGFVVGELMIRTIESGGFIGVVIDEIDDVSNPVRAVFDGAGCFGQLHAICGG